MLEARPTIDDMVFENRNKEYGSYLLRKKFYIFLGIGFLCSLVVVLLTSLGYFWYLAEAGDENIYLYPSSSIYLKSVQGSLLTPEELKTYMGSPAKPENPVPEHPETRKSGSSINFKVTENAHPDTFKPEPEISASETVTDDLGLLVNDSTAFGGFLSGEGIGSGGIFDRIPEFMNGTFI